jgi:hypothetical protein
MEPIEITEEQHPEEPKGLLLPEEAQYYLQKSGEWARFLGIMGFIMSAFIALCAFFIGSIFSMMSVYRATPYPAGMGGIMGFFYILIAVFYFIFSLYLYKFGSKIKEGIAYHDTTQVTIALSKLKSFFKLWGITTIVIIAFYILIIVGVAVGITLARR